MFVIVGTTEEVTIRIYHTQREIELNEENKRLREQLFDVQKKMDELQIKSAKIRKYCKL